MSVIIYQRKSSWQKCHICLVGISGIFQQLKKKQFQQLKMTETYFSECNAGYYGSANTTCTQCPGNTIKTSQGDATGCDTDILCDGINTVPNVDYSACDMFYI